MDVLVAALVCVCVCVCVLCDPLLMNEFKIVLNAYKLTLKILSHSG